MNATNLADLYDLPLVDWERVRARLDRGLDIEPGKPAVRPNTCWLATINSDGSPHVTGIGALWVSGCFYFETGETTRKGRNLARDPRCTLSLATDEFDLVVDGDAVLVDEPQQVAEMAQRWAAEGWPCRVDSSGIALTADFSAPSAGPPPWRVYRLAPRQATVVLAAEPGGATRWRF